MGPTIDIAAQSPSADLLGYVLIGTFLTVMLNGILSMQTHRYFLRSKHDTIWIKLLVGWTTSVALTAGALAIAFIYIRIIVDFGDTSIMENETSTTSTNIFRALMTIPPLSSAPTQIFYGWRVARLAECQMIFYIVIFFALAETVLGVYSPYISSQQVNGTLGHSVVYVWSALTLTLDIVLSAMVILYIQKKRDKNTQTNSTLFKIQALTVGSGALTSTWVVLCATFYIIGNGGILQVFFIPQTTVYPCALLACLNMRINFGGASNSRQGHTQNINMSVKQERTVTRAIEDVDPITSAARVNIVTDGQCDCEKPASEIINRSFFSTPDDTSTLSNSKLNDKENNHGVYISTVGHPTIPLSLQISSSKLDEDLGRGVRVHGLAPSVQYTITMPQRSPTLYQHRDPGGELASTNEQEVEEDLEASVIGDTLSKTSSASFR